MFFEFPILLMCRFVKYCKEIPPPALSLSPQRAGERGSGFWGLRPCQVLEISREISSHPPFLSNAPLRRNGRHWEERF